MSRLSRHTLLFALVCALFFVAPALLNKQLSWYPLVRTGDLFDILTPVVFIPLYWLLYQIGQDRVPGLSGSVIFLVLTVFWVEGHGMHLAANSIGHLLSEMKGSGAYRLTRFYDEILSHYLLHLGIVGLSTLLIFHNPFTGERAALWSESVAGIIHGFTYFVIVIEGRTALLGVPFAILATTFCLIWGRKKFRQQPLLAFYFVSYLLATLFFAGWAIYWGGLPEFSKVGIID